MLFFFFFFSIYTMLSTIKNLSKKMNKIFGLPFLFVPLFVWFQSMSNFTNLCGHGWGSINVEVVLPHHCLSLKFLSEVKKAYVGGNFSFLFSSSYYVAQGMCKSKQTKIYSFHSFVFHIRLETNLDFCHMYYLSLCSA
jgi:hypothetical protein